MSSGRTVQLHFRVTPEEAAEIRKRIEESGIITTQRQDALRRRQVDGWHEDSAEASLTGPCDDLAAVLSVFLAIQMSMRVDEPHDSRFIIWFMYFSRFCFRSASTLTLSRHLRASSK